MKRVQALTLMTVALAALGYAALARGEERQKRDSDQPAAARIFMHDCKDCHGEDGRGRMLNQPDFTSREWHKKVTDDQLFKTIKFGREPMPFYAGALTDEEIAALVKYIRSLGADRSAAVAPAPQPADNCRACHQEKTGEIVALYSRSVHARSGISCSRCHHGTASAATKEEAHQPRFIGHPSSGDVITMCGSCHAAELAQFKTSRHFPERRGVARVDCVQCHGAHTVGAPSRNFSMAYLCAGCHGLEYLPENPREIQKLLALTDEMRDALRGLEESGRKPADDLVKLRKEVRRMVAEIVHPTDLKGGIAKAPQILKLGEQFKQELMNSK